MNCRYCGAPLELGPDSVVVVCRYCGTANFTESDMGQVFVAPTLTSSDILKKAVERTRKDLNLRWRMSDIKFNTSPDLTYLPYYFVNVELYADYVAKVIATSQKRRYVLRVSGTVRLSDTVPLLARRSTWGRSGEVLGRYYLKRPPPLATLSEATEWASRGVFLAAEYNKEEAKNKAVRVLLKRLEEEVNRDALSKARLRAGPSYTLRVIDRVVDYVVTRLEASELTYLPMWTALYLYRDSHYRYYIAGWDGAVMLAEKPVFVEHRIAYFLTTAIVSGSVGAFVAPLIYTDLTMATAAFLLASTLTYSTAAMLLRSRRVE